MLFGGGGSNSRCAPHSRAFVGQAVQARRPAHLRPYAFQSSGSTAQQTCMHCELLAPNILSGAQGSLKLSLETLIR